MMSDQPCKTPLLELARSVPEAINAIWETQWFEDGTPCGHAMAPVGRYIHDLADALEAKDAELERLQNLLKVAKCPNENCTNGAVFSGLDPDGQDQWEQCQWCDEVNNG
jgi:hypothetical protein